MIRSHGSFVDVRRRHIVLIGLFDALDRAGVRPVPPRLIHTLWYLANALAPAWQMQPFDSALLKTERQPYFPSVQADLDVLVGRGLLYVTALTALPGALRLQGRFALNRAFADRVLEMMWEIEEEADLLRFLDEVVQAANRLGEAEQGDALTQDATYGDPGIDQGNVVDLGQWLVDGALTPTAQVFRRLDDIADRELLPAERMELYIDHLAWRLRND